MSKRLSEKTKELRKMGMGSGKEYKPYITTSEFNSQGTTSVIRDWKTGRGVHCLSQGEMMLYYILRWDDKNLDIREQFPLDAKEVSAIAKSMNINSPRDIMTTDMLVTRIDGTMAAYSVKASSNLSKRQLELLCIEKKYWISKGVDYHLIFKNDMNRVLVSNIRLVTEFYDVSRVFDTISALKHKIAIKEIVIDMETDPIDSDTLNNLLFKLSSEEK